MKIVASFFEPGTLVQILSEGTFKNRIGVCAKMGSNTLIDGDEWLKNNNLILVHFDKPFGGGCFSPEQLKVIKNANKNPR